MQNTTPTQPGTPTAGQPVNSDIDVNQTDHISSQLDQDDNEEDVEEDDDDITDEEDEEEEDVTDEETDDIEWDPNQQAGDKGDGQTL